MSQPAGPLFTPGNRKAAVKFLTNLTPDQQRNLEKMLNHQPKLKRMWNATMKTAEAAWNSQPGLQARYVGNQVAAGTGAAVRGAQFAAHNPRQAWDNTVDAGGQALSATGRGLGNAAVAAGRGAGNVAAATGRGAGNMAVAAGRGIANSAVGQGVASTTRNVASGIANSRIGRWVSDKWSRGTVAAEAGFRAFKEGRANPAAPQVSAKDGVDLSNRAIGVSGEQNTEAKLAAAMTLISELQEQVEKLNATTMQAAQAPASQAAQAPTFQAPGEAPQQGNGQGADQGAQQRPAQTEPKKGTGVQR
ncbi:MAG TPA: hypothetical protein VFH76_25010 [Kribbella sp.]|nr:hypothetical protein [Kribbella sp.]